MSITTAADAWDEAVEYVTGMLGYPNTNWRNPYRPDAAADTVPAGMANISSGAALDENPGIPTPAVPAVDQGVRESGVYAADNYTAQAWICPACHDDHWNASWLADHDAHVRAAEVGPYVRLNLALGADLDAALAREGALRAGVEALADEWADAFITGRAAAVPMHERVAALRALLVDPGGEG